MTFSVLTICCSILLMYSCGKEKKVETPEELKLISLNIRYDNPEDGEHTWTNRKEGCVAMFNDEKPDIFGLQEALDNQIAYLQEHLPQYTSVGIGRDPESDKDEHCSIFFLNDKFDLVEDGTFWLSETPEVPSNGWDARYHRIATWVHLKEKSTAKELIYINTHFDHKGKVARYESSKLLVERLKSLGKDSIPVLASGDFNVTPQDSLFIPIQEYLVDLRSTVAPQDSMQTTNGWGTEPAGKIIDYIFYKNIEPVSYTVSTKNYGVPYISDHYPVIGIFKY